MCVTAILLFVSLRRGAPKAVRQGAHVASRSAGEDCAAQFESLGGAQQSESIGGAQGHRLAWMAGQATEPAVDGASNIYIYIVVYICIVIVLVH